MLELTGNNDLSDADCRFNQSDIDYAVPGTIQRRAPARRHASNSSEVLKRPAQSLCEAGAARDHLAAGAAP